MLHAIKNCHNTSIRNSTRMIPSFPPFDEPNLCNGYIFMDPEHNDRLYFLNQVHSNIDLLDNVILQQVVIQPTEKSKSVGPHKSKLKTTTYKKKSCIKNKKFRSASTQLHRGSTEPTRNGTNLLQRHLFYTNKDLKNYQFIDAGTFIPIVTWKLTKNRSYIIIDKPLSSCSLYSGNNQRSKLDIESSSIPVKDIELFCRFIRRLLFTSKIARPDVQACVTYALTIMKLPMNYCKNRNLNTDLLFTKKI